MSYSRWSDSSWYVFWDSMYSGDTKESQHLSAWYSMDDDGQISWSYERVDSLLKKPWEQVISTLQHAYKCNGDEANELQEYMQQWRSDVNQKFSALL
mgnify:CR=1 FL=1